MVSTGSDGEDSGPDEEGAASEAIADDEQNRGGEGEFQLNGRTVDLSLLTCKCLDPEGCVLPRRCHTTKRDGGGPGKK